jgi:endogenous inhibitor of DNA gyrase (YacG/DUF329 family)
MKCEKCLFEREDRDFFKKQTICYRCVYKEKIEMYTKKLNIRKNHCRICKKEINFEQNAKKRQRNIFCSPECAEIGLNDLRKKHWTKMS